MSASRCRVTKLIVLKLLLRLRYIQLLGASTPTTNANPLPKRRTYEFLPKNATAESLEELRRLERLWRRCGQGWFITHWLLLSTNLAAAVVMLAGPRLGLSPDALVFASVYVPASTLVIATLKPSTRSSTFISAYRMMYFALLKQKLSALSMDKVIAVAEQAETLIAQSGYMPSLGDISAADKPAAIERLPS